MPDGNWTLSDMVSVIAFAANEPSKSQRLIGGIFSVSISFRSTKDVSIKESVELESRSAINLSTTEVSRESSGRVNSVESTMWRDCS